VVIEHNMDFVTDLCHRVMDKGIGFVPQGRNLFGQLTAWQNLELGGITLGMKTPTSAFRKCWNFSPRVKERMHSQAAPRSIRCRRQAAGRGRGRRIKHREAADGSCDSFEVRRPLTPVFAWGEIAGALSCGVPIKSGVHQPMWSCS